MVAAFRDRLLAVNPAYTTFSRLKTLQVNLGDLCNLSCAHCHVQASPSGKRIMPRQVMQQICALLARRPGLTLDITGGCPEMNPHFRFFIEATAGLAPRRILRSNLTIMAEPEMSWLPEFCRDQNLVITASLPCYLEENVDRQRGPGVHSTSIAVLQELNRLGYGSHRELNLVYNPGGEYLPGSQQALEQAYRQELETRYGVTFSRLHTITNAPVGRFRTYLEATGTLQSYLDRLAAGFNPGTASEIMCRTLISVDWQGFLYNCDFNQAEGLPLTAADGTLLTSADLLSGDICGSELILAQHCYCCTAGAGSSCTGALAG